MMVWLTWAPLCAGQSRTVDRLVESRQLYESAEYDRALAVMDAIDARGAAPEIARDRAFYQALCLFALNHEAEAAARIETVFELDPRFDPGSDLSPRVQAFVDRVRARVLPSLAHQHYRAGKALFDSKRYDAALNEFLVVLELANDDDAAGGAPVLSDVRALAEGFRDLSARALADARSVVARRPEATLVPPVVITQALPPWPANLSPSTLVHRNGVLELVVSARGDVGSVTVLVGIHPAYDQLLIAAARRWRYRPATRDGEPVAFVKRLAVSVNTK
jgi:tetratricopeptide (TPR) repeat protein